MMIVVYFSHGPRYGYGYRSGYREWRLRIPVALVKSRANFLRLNDYSGLANVYEGSGKLAEREGFEPPVPFQARRFSRPEPSTTRPPLRLSQFYYKLGLFAAYPQMAAFSRRIIGCQSNTGFSRRSSLNMLTSPDLISKFPFLRASARWYHIDLHGQIPGSLASSCVH